MMITLTIILIAIISKRLLILSHKFQIICCFISMNQLKQKWQINGNDSLFQTVVFHLHLDIKIQIYATERRFKVGIFCFQKKGTTSSSAPDAEDAGPDGAGGSRSPSTTSASVSPRPQQSQPSLGGVSTPPPTPIRAPPPPPSTVGGLGPPGER